MNIMLSASDSTKRLGLLKAATMNLRFLELAQGLGLECFVGLGDSFRRLGLSSPAVLARVSSLAALANFRTVQPGSQPDVLQNQPVALYRAVVERWRDRNPIDIDIGTALMIIENRVGTPYEYSRTYLEGLKQIGVNRERQLAFSRKAKKSLGEEPEDGDLSKDEIAAKVDGFRAIEKALYEMELRDADPTLTGLCFAVEKWATLWEEREAIIKYLSSPEGNRRAPTMSVSVESQAVLSNIVDAQERGAILKALKHETGQDDATDTIAGLLLEGATREELQGNVTRNEINQTLDRLGYPEAKGSQEAVVVANKFGGSALATVSPV